MTDVLAALRAALGADRARRDVPLAPMTTFRVGGPADLLIETRSSDEIVAALKLAHQAGVPVTLLGGGSNVLVADAGVRGLVIRPLAGAIRLVDVEHVHADASVKLGALVRWTIVHGCAGIEAWAGMPGTVGGAVVGNAHFGGRGIDDCVSFVRLAARDGSLTEVNAIPAGCVDVSNRLRRTGEVLLAAAFTIAPGDPALLRALASEAHAFRKRTQPVDALSAGCVFQNPEPTRDAVPDGVPWSAGALIDRAGLKGSAIGGACVSPVHGNFIVNEGTATARDIRQLIERCRTGVRDQFGVELREEIVYLGDFSG